MTPAQLAGPPSEAVVCRSGRDWLTLAAHQAFTADGGGGEPSGFAACALTGEPEAVAGARHFAARTLAGWGLAALADDLSVVVSELLGNAVRHGLPGTAAGEPAGAEGRPIWLGLLRQGATVLCAVCDPGTGVPAVREPDVLAETGRGLRVVDSLSDSWGWTAPDRAGKAVWACLSLPGRPAADPCPAGAARDEPDGRLRG